MKPILCLFLTLIMILSLCACRTTMEETPASTESTTVPPAAEPTAPAQTQPTPTYSIPFSAVSMPLVREILYAEDGAEIFRYTYQNIFPTFQDPDVATDISVNLLNRMDAINASAEALKVTAEAAYKASENTSFFPYRSAVYYNPMRIDRDVLSFFGSETSYEGGAHPSGPSISASYDLVTGRYLSFGDIVVEGFDDDTLCGLIVDALSKQKDTLYLYDDYADIVFQRYDGRQEYSESWFFSPDGLCFYFSPYDIAPYASGTVVAEIPYALLPGILKDDYFPTERVSYSGEMEIEFFAPEKMDGFQQIAEAILDPNGQYLLLYTQGRVYDIFIDTGYMEWGDEYVAEATVFAAETMGAEDAVMLQANIAESENVLRVRYHNGEETVSCLISIDPADGSAIFTMS